MATPETEMTASHMFTPVTKIITPIKVLGNTYISFYSFYCMCLSPIVYWNALNIDKKLTKFYSRYPCAWETPDEKGFFVIQDLFK